MLSKENKKNIHKQQINVIKDNKMYVLDKENKYPIKNIVNNSTPTKEIARVLDISFKSIKYVNHELQLKTIEIISDLIDLGIPIKYIDDIVTEGVKKYYNIMCENKETNKLIHDFK